MPPGSPHMGGLWEGVKSIKYLRRVVGKATLTFVEFYTLLCQVEVILNSRPICSLSSNPEHLQVLTPGHFLIGTSLLALQDHNLLDVSSNRLSKWLCSTDDDCGDTGPMTNFINSNREINGKTFSQMLKLVN